MLDRSFTERWDFVIVTFIFFHSKLPDPSVTQDVAGEAIHLANPDEFASGCFAANGLGRELD